MWVDYRGSLSTVYNDGGISTCGEIIEVHSVQSTTMGDCGSSEYSWKDNRKASHCDVV